MKKLLEKITPWVIGAAIIFFVLDEIGRELRKPSCEVDDMCNIPLHNN
jgi:hypothetical protein